MFAAAVYEARRQRLCAQVGSGLILLLGNQESPMNYADNTYPFRQDSTFLYFFGLDTPGLAALLDPEAGTHCVFGQDLTLDDIVWMGYQPSLEQRCRQVGITQHGTLTALEEVLARAVAQQRAIHFLPPYRAENTLRLQRWLGLNPPDLAAQASVPLIQGVVAQRSLKGPEEIAQIEQAVGVSVDMHVAAMRLAQPGMSEATVAAAVHQVALAAGGGLSFPIIATVQGQTLHNHYHGNQLNNGDLFLLDAGAENALHYAGDLSSTFPVAPRFTEQQREIYAITLAAHRAAAGALRPGVKYLDVHQTACRTLAQGLVDLGLMKGDVAAAVEVGAHALFFPCGTGHMLGLDVHDMEDLGERYVGYDGQARSTQFGLKSLRLARELQPGFVLTIEPGLYFIPQLIDRWRAEQRFTEFINYAQVERYRNFGGIRNEENYLITTTGSRLLGKPKPMTLEEVEAIRSTTAAHA